MTATGDAGYMAVPPTEQETVLAVFHEMLKMATGDGGRKRAAGTKPAWWRDPAHEPAIFSHLNKWYHGEQRDPDSGAHPLVHLAWRALAIAYQETYGTRDPELHALWRPEPPRDHCIYCLGPLGGSYYGAGWGDGKRFACAPCFESRQRQAEARFIAGADGIEDTAA